LPNDFVRKEERMGGFGSGRWYRWDTKSKLESVVPLDVRYLQRSGKLYPGSRSPVLWKNTGGAFVGSIIVEAEEDYITLQYRHQRGKDSQPVQETIALTWTSCHYGGQRVWFICPWCETRVAIVYGDASFVCRRCCALKYESQSEHRGDRQRRKAQMIRLRLGGSANLAEPFPAKPKHMHWKTYEQLHSQAIAAETMSLFDMAAQIARMQAALDKQLAKSG
jgi:hypothetical protein